MFSVINLSCLGFNREHSPSPNVTALVEHNSILYVVMTLMCEKLKFVYRKDHALDFSCF